MFRIGDKIMIIEAGDGARGCNGRIGIVTNNTHVCGIHANNRGFNVELESGVYDPEEKEVWRVNHDGKYTLMEGNNIMSNGDEICEEDVFVCLDCGVIYDKVYSHPYENGYLCDNCYDDYFTCDDCGETYKKSDGYYSYGDGYICESCYNDDYYTCDRCGDIHYHNDMVIVNSNSRYVEHVCADCAESYYYLCIECDEWHSYQFMWSTGDNCVCDNCSDRYTTCDNCEAVISCEDACGGDYGTYCESCFNDRQYRSLHDYGYKPDPNFLGEMDDNLYMGIELEVDKGDGIMDCCDAIQEITDDVYMKEDGSISNGFEIVSHPATIEYHMTELPWESIMKKCIEYGFRSHDTTTCGIHVHVSRKYFGTALETQDLNIAKAILLINRFWDTHITTFSRRNYSSLIHWAKKSELILEPDDTTEKLIYKMKDENCRGDRYMAVNLQNRNTIEFRIFRGTLKIDTFFAILQFVKTICEFAKGVSLQDIDGTTWNDIFGNSEYEELNAYNKSKDLN